MLLSLNIFKAVASNKAYAGLFIKNVHNFGRKSKSYFSVLFNRIGNIFIESKSLNADDNVFIVDNNVYMRLATHHFGNFNARAYGIIFANRKHDMFRTNAKHYPLFLLIFA